MAPFRLYSVRINENNITTDNVTLISPRHSVGRQNEYSNYFSLIIGNNGTGKSRLLCSIAKLFKQIYKDKNSTKLFGSKANFNTVPNKVIALTNSLSDHFPLDSSFKKYRSVYERYNRADDFIRNLYKDSRYIYLGPRSRNNFLVHPTFRVMRQSCRAYSLRVKYRSSLNPYALRFITFILLLIPSTFPVET